MALLSVSYSQGSYVLRFKLLDSSVTTGAGLTGLDHTSAGLIIATICDNEATTTRYRASSSELEAVVANGTYTAPTSGKARFKVVDATNHPGVYEVQLAAARFAVVGARYMIVSISGATNLAQCDAVISLEDQSWKRF